MQCGLFMTFYICAMPFLIGQWYHMHFHNYVSNVGN